MRRWPIVFVLAVFLVPVFTCPAADSPAPTVYPDIDVPGGREPSGARGGESLETLCVAEFRDVGADAINDALKGTPMAGTGQAVINGARLYDIDPRLMVAIAMLESRCGASPLAQLTGNAYGIGAIDSDPMQARRYSTSAKGDYDCAKLLGIYADHGRDTIPEIGARWATDPLWGQKIARIWVQQFGEEG